VSTDSGEGQKGPGDGGCEPQCVTKTATYLKLSAHKFPEERGRKIDFFWIFFSETLKNIQNFPGGWGEMTHRLSMI
jgi:hypothetical protein